MNGCWLLLYISLGPAQRIVVNREVINVVMCLVRLQNSAPLACGCLYGIAWTVMLHSMWEWQHLENCVYIGPSIYIRNDSQIWVLYLRFCTSKVPRFLSFLPEVSPGHHILCLKGIRWTRINHLFAAFPSRAENSISRNSKLCSV